jgi:pimeloyl-ACP methyl ester carboxylesterase
MKKLSHILLFSFFCLLLNPAFGQEEIQFGSNNGQYISIFSTKIYYEEYGEIEGRALIVLGDRDMITLEHGIHMFRAIKGSEFCVLPNTPHEVFSSNPDQIKVMALDFFTRW